LPNWLSDLVPDYLPDANVLICPVCQRTGQIERPPLADPYIASSYLFEFCPAQLGNGAPANPTATRREWKNRQMAVVGPIVPIVRCRHHKSPLNLAFDGRIYDSPTSWEMLLTNTVDPKSLTSAQMYAAVASTTNSPPAKKTPPRRNKAAPQSSGLAQTIRVTALDLAAADLFGKSLDEIARKLKMLTPDVVLLRGIAGRKMAVQIVKALEPAHYRVVACSAFGSTANFGTNANQLAILARKTAYFYWSEPWNFENAASADGGFTFAAIEIAGHRFGFVSLNASRKPEHQWLENLTSYRAWSTNRLEGFVVATFQPTAVEGETERMFRLAGFHDPLTEPPNSSATDLIEGHLVPNADTPKGLLLSKAPFTCDFDFHPAPLVAIVTNVPIVANQLPTSPPRANASATFMQASAFWIAVCLALILMTIVAMLLGIRRRLNRLQTQNALVPASSYNVVIAPPASAMSTPLPEAALTLARVSSVPTLSHPPEPMSHHSLFAHFSQWLKQAFVQRLINDRQQLLAEREVAARKVSSVDERLARLETKIQQQTTAYEKEIELLNQKLLTAREENLELVRSQIKFLKSEMESTRARVLESEEP
jgi:uncharacterized coiled-coil protein SlyX